MPPTPEPPDPLDPLFARWRASAPEPADELETLVWRRLAVIGAIICCSARGVETRLYRARQFLKAELTRHIREAGRV